MDQLCVTEKRKEKRLNKDNRVHRKKRFSTTVIYTGNCLKLEYDGQPDLGSHLEQHGIRTFGPSMTSSIHSSHRKKNAQFC